MSFDAMVCRSIKTHKLCLTVGSSFGSGTSNSQLKSFFSLWSCLLLWIKMKFCTKWWVWIATLTNRENYVKHSNFLLMVHSSNFMCLHHDISFYLIFTIVILIQVHCASRIWVEDNTWYVTWQPLICPWKIHWINISIWATAHLPIP